MNRVFSDFAAPQRYIWGKRLRKELASVIARNLAALINFRYFKLRFLTFKELDFYLLKTFTLIENNTTLQKISHDIYSTGGDSFMDKLDLRNPNQTSELRYQIGRYGQYINLSEI